MKRYTSLLVLSALFGAALTQILSINDISSQSFLDYDRMEFDQDSAKAACYIFKDLTFWDITKTMNEVDGVPTDSVIALDSFGDNGHYGPDA